MYCLIQFFTFCLKVSEANSCKVVKGSSIVLQIITGRGGTSSTRAICSIMKHSEKPPPDHEALIATPCRCVLIDTH